MKTCVCGLRVQSFTLNLFETHSRQAPGIYIPHGTPPKTASERGKHATLTTVQEDRCHNSRVEHFRDGRWYALLVDHLREAPPHCLHTLHLAERGEHIATGLCYDTVQVLESLHLLQRVIAGRKTPHILACLTCLTGGRANQYCLNSTGWQGKQLFPATRTRSDTFWKAKCQQRSQLELALLPGRPCRQSSTRQSHLHLAR